MMILGLEFSPTAAFLMFGVVMFLFIGAILFYGWLHERLENPRKGESLSMVDPKVDKKEGI